MAKRNLKTSMSLDARTMRTLRAQAAKLNISISALMRVIAAKLEAGEIRL